MDAWMPLLWDDVPPIFHRFLIPAAGWQRRKAMIPSKIQWITMFFSLMFCLQDVYAEERIRIQPFHFPDNVKEGQKVQAMCGLLQGDVPVTFVWQKNGEPIMSGAQVSVTKHTDFSRIVINSADVQSSGNYTCIAKNLRHQDSYTAHLAVRGPPKWIKEPSDTSTSLGDSVTLSCATYGFPTPEVTWRRTNETVPDQWTPVVSNRHFHIASDGSLTISGVQNEDSGLYQCHVSNGIGETLSKTVSVNIKVPAKFENKLSVETVRWGETATLHCEAFGDNPITITWTKNDKPISEKESTRYEIFTTVTERGTSSELHVQVADREDNGLYMCVAKNTFGKDERNVKLVVLEVPGPPSDVRVEQTWSQSASVRWTVPYGGNSPIKSFVVQYWRDSGAPHRLLEETVLATQTFTMLKDLQPGTSYVIRVLAENEVGRGNPSESQQFLTKEAEPSAPPTDVTVESRGAGTLRVKWKMPPKDQWNGQLKGYYIGYQVSSSSEPYSFKTVEFNKQQDEEEYKLTNLQKATEYRVIVQAFNSAGSGPASQDVLAKTSDTDPPSPPFLWVDFQSRSSIGLKWKHKPAATEAKETSTLYTLYYKDEYGPWSEITVPRSSESQYTLSGLREGTRYQMYLKATSDSGESDPSDILTVKTEGGALSDASSHPIVEHGEDVPIYLRLSVIAPLGTSVGIILVVLIGACFYVRREEKRYKATVPGGPDRHYSYSGSSTLPHPHSQRYVDVDKTRPLLKLPGVPIPPHPPPGGYPAPYATMPLRGSSTADRRRAINEEHNHEIMVGRNGVLPQNTVDRKRLAGLTIQETAEVHHYDMAA